MAFAVTLGSACSTSDDRTVDSPSAAEDDEVTPTPGGVLRVGLALETSGYNPALDRWPISGYVVAQSIFDRLMAYDESSQVRPYLAESVTSNADFTEWTIRLRPGVRFHDGTDLDAAALKTNLDAIKASPGQGQGLLAVESVEVVDELSVLVTMSSPWSSFPHTLTFQPGYVAAPSMLQDPEGGRHPVGTGPFVFEEWTDQNHVKVSRNDDYWRPDYPLLDGIDYVVIAEPTSRVAALQSGDVDLIESRDPAYIADFEEREESGEPYRVYLDTQGETTEEALFFNLDAAPFTSRTARRAVIAAIDKQTLSETVYDGRFPPAEGPFKESSPWHRPVAWQGYDPDLAAELADQYQRDTGEQLSFTFMTRPDSSSLAIAETIQQMMATVDIEMQIDAVEQASFMLRGLNGDYQAATINQLWGSIHPDREYPFLHGDNARPVGELGTAFTRFRGDKLDAALEVARQTSDPRAQADAWAEVQEAIADEFVWTFLVHDDIGVIASDRVHGLTEWTFPDGTVGLPQEQTLVPLTQIWLDD